MRTGSGSLGNKTVMAVDSNGHIGINTDPSPDAAFTVDGKIQADRFHVVAPRSTNPNDVTNTIPIDGKPLVQIIHMTNFDNIKRHRD